MSAESVRPIRVAVVNDYEVVVAGLAAMLAPYSHRVQVVELDERTPMRSEVDVVLVDPFGKAGRGPTTIRELAADTRPAPLRPQEGRPEMARRGDRGSGHRGSNGRPARMRVGWPAMGGIRGEPSVSGGRSMPPTRSPSSGRVVNDGCARSPASRAHLPRPAVRR
jgi:hypothetical protein